MTASLDGPPGAAPSPSLLGRLFGRPRERRHDRRVDGAGAWLVHRGHRLPVVDLSLGGLRVQHAPAALVQPGERIAFALDLPMTMHSLTVHGQGEVVRVFPGGFALRYLSPDHRTMRSLHYFIDGRAPRPRHR